MSETEVKKTKEERKQYRETLGTVERARYLEKLKLINGTDPYELKNLSVDVQLLPAVTYPDIVNYLVYSPSPYTLEDLKCFKGLEAYNQFVCGWVSGVSTVVVQDKHLVKARVLHSQRLREKPLSPWVIAKKDGTILSSHCDCMAGLGETCTHVAALLFAIDGTVKIRDSRTVTQEPAYWLLPTALKTASYRETRSIDFSAAKTLKKRFDKQVESQTATPSVQKRSKSKVPVPTDDELKTFFVQLDSSERKPAILSLVPDHADRYVPNVLNLKLPATLNELKDPSSLTLNFKDLVEKCSTIKINISEEESKNVEMVTKKQSKCKEWFDHRAGRVTASKMKAACVTDPSNPAQSLVKSICYPESHKFSSVATQWGQANESVALSKFRKVMEEGNIHDNVQIEECGLFISTEHPHIAASPDSTVSCDCCGRGCIEIKCPASIKNEPVSDKCDFLKYSEDHKLQLDQAHAYFYQVQTQMGVTRTEYTYFVVYTNIDIHVELILFDNEFFGDMCRKATALFQVAILPELIGKFYTRLPGSGISKSQNQPAVLQMKDQTHQNVDCDINIDTEERWCYCDQVESGKMIGCDNENCTITWFHFTCLKMTSNPKAKKWYCPECRKLPEFSRKRKNVA